MKRLKSLVLTLLLVASAHAQITEVAGGFYFPRPPSAGIATPVFGASPCTVDAADEAVAFLITYPKTGNIAKVGWGTRTVTTGATIGVSLETLASGFPTGTLLATNTSASQVVADANDNISFLTPLTAVAAVTHGQAGAVVFRNPNTSFGNMQIGCFADDVENLHPNVGQYTGAWADAVGVTPIVYFEYDDGSYAAPPGTWPIKDTLTQLSLSTSTTPDVAGLQFQLPFAVRVIGVWFWGDVDGDGAFRLVTTSYHQANQTGVLGSIAVTSLDDLGTAGGVQLRYFPAAIDLSANTNYRLIVEPSSTNTITTYDYNLISLAAMDAAAGGQYFHFTSAKDPTADGSWTNYNSGTFRKPFMGLIVSGFSSGSSVTVGYPIQ